MKKLYVLITISCCALYSQAQSIDSIIHQLNGCWHWDHYFGGFPGLPPTPATYNVYAEFYLDGTDSLSGTTVSTRVYRDTTLKFSGRCNVTKDLSDTYFLLSCPLFDSVGVAGSPPVYFDFEGDTLLFPQQEFVDGFVYAFLQTCGDTITKVESPPAIAVEIYPNPASEQLVVDLEKTQAVQIELYNAIGSRVITMNTSNNSRITMDVSSFPEGTYFLHITAKQGLSTKKILITR